MSDVAIGVVLVDANVILDIRTGDRVWARWSSQALADAAGFLAANAFLRYRRAGGARRSPLPDFYIGAHAAVSNLMLLTRDASRYRTYFPSVRLIAPKR